MVYRNLRISPGITEEMGGTGLDGWVWYGFRWMDLVWVKIEVAGTGKDGWG